MRQFTVKHVDAFTTEPFSGNPAGVITEADELTVEMMQRIASEMYLSETSFVTIPESENTSFRIRFFTPSNEVDMSGHVTIAACFALIEDGRIDLDDGITNVQFETNIGNVPLNVHFKRGYTSKILDGREKDGVAISIDGKNTGKLERIMLHQPIQHYRPATIPDRKIASILGIEETEVLGTGLPVEIISTGLNQLMVPVMHKETILNMKPDLIKLGLVNLKLGIDTNHIFTLDTFNPDCTTYSRHFAPAVGMWEDHATGTAAAGLGTYLVRHGISISRSMVMEQGKEVENLARILVEIDQAEGENSSAWIGGLAVTSITRKINIENEEIVII